MKSEFQYYKKDNSNYVADGNVSLTPSSSKFKIELNGMCEMTLVHPYDKDGRWKLLSLEDGVIKAPTPWSDGQLFVIYDTQKKLTGIEVSAYHIFFDLNYSKILDRRAELKNGQQALDILLQGTKYTGYSNIKTVNTCYFEDINRVAAINGDKDNTFIKRWGGEIFLDNFNITINDHIGGDYGAFVSYGVNMQELGLKRDMTGIITRCYPKAYNGYTLPEKHIDSPLINSYRIIKEGDLDCSELKLQEDCSEEETGYKTLEELYSAMREKVKEAYNKGLDKPSISGTCKVAPLENTTKYKDVKGLVSIGLGDIVTVTHEDIGVNSKTRCVGYEWDQISRKFEEVTLGELEVTCFDNTSDASNKINNILNNDGSINALNISGVINALSTKFKAMRDIAQDQHIRAMLFEDKVKGSKTYGAMCIGSMGFEIANKRTPDDKDWEWRTFGTGTGFTADEIVAGTLTAILIQSLDKKTFIDLATGKFQLGAGDGSTVATHTNSGSTWKHSDGSFSEANAKGFYKDGRPYHSLMTAGYCVTGGSAGAVPKTATIQLGDEWKGKPFTVLASTVDTQGGIAMEYVKRIQLNVTNIDTVNARFNITGSWTSVYNGQENDKELKSMYIVIGG